MTGTAVQSVAQVTTSSYKLSACIFSAFYVIKIQSKEKIENIEKSLGTKFQNHHKNLYNPINSSSVNKWKVDLDSDLALDIHKYLIKNSLRFNYDLNR